MAATADSKLSLFFVKTRDPQSGNIEVHVADQASSYGPPPHHYVSGYNQQDGPNGKWVVSDNNLYFIKTRNSGSGTIELHRTTGSSGYRDFDLHTGTAFSLSDADNGTWTVSGTDLYFIKTKNTGSGKIEVHRAGHANYNEFNLHAATALPESEAGNGTWRIANGDLYFIKYNNTPTPNSVELYILRASDNYSKVTQQTTWFNNRDGPDGTWDIGANGDLYFLKLRNTGTKTAEVHIASAASKYSDVAHSGSWIGDTDGPNGTWGVSPFKAA